MFKALLIDKQDGKQSARLADVADNDLPEGAVTVRVEFSTVNYKDGLAITGKSPVVRKFPMVPGIDFAGVVESSDSNDFRAGDRVLLNGWGVGEGHWGGFAQKARVKAEWLQKVPEKFSTQQAMAIGTAGLPRQPLRRRPGCARSHAGSRRGASDGRVRRRRQHRHCAARQIWISGRRGDRQSERVRLSQGARSRADHRS